MIAIDLKSRKSIYEQVVFSIKEQILAGIIAPETKLPSVRELSKELTVNPNTVQKAFRELESQGYIYSVAGVGNFARSPQEIKPDRRLVETAMSKLTDAVRELRLLIPDRETFKGAVSDALISVEPDLLYPPPAQPGPHQPTQSIRHEQQEEQDESHGGAQ